MNSRSDPECDYVYKSIIINYTYDSYFNLVVLSGEMGVGKSNILQRYLKTQYYTTN